ncbi:MAG: hypothetical protein ACUVTW_00685 [Thermogutta sp.]
MKITKSGTITADERLPLRELDHTSTVAPTIEPTLSYTQYGYEYDVGDHGSPSTVKKAEAARHGPNGTDAGAGNDSILLALIR